MTSNDKLHLRTHDEIQDKNSNIIFFAALKRISPSHILNVVFRYWSKNTDNSSLEIQSVRERVSIFTVLSLYPKFAHHASRLFWMKSLRSSESGCKDSVLLSAEVCCLAESAPHTYILFPLRHRFPLLYPRVLR